MLPDAGVERCKGCVVLQALVLGVGLIAVGCGSGGGDGGGDQGVQQSALNGPPVILAFGDSITWGLGDNTVDVSRLIDEGGYPHRLQNLLQVRVINSGIPGEETEAGLVRLQKDLANHHPDYVILLEGTNDVRSNNDTTVSVLDMEAMIESVKAANAVPLLGTITPFCYHEESSSRNTLVTIYNRELRALALMEGVKLIDFHRAFTGSEDGECDEAAQLIWTDGIHPRPAGYDLMAATAADVLNLKRPQPTATPGGS